MAGITALGTTYNLPNYTGILFDITPEDTPFLSAIGGLTGGMQCNSNTFEWESYDLRAAGQNVALEGADAPTAQERVRSNIFNTVQIQQESVSVSYTKLAAVGAKAGINNDATNPVTNEVDWQITQRLKEMKRDIEFSFINGVYQLPTDNTTPRKTRGLLAAIATNAVAAAGATLGRELMLSAMQLAWDNGGLQESGTATVMCNSVQKRWLTKAFIADANYQQLSATVGGVAVDRIVTDFGTLNIMLNRYVPADTVIVASLEQCAPVFQEIPGKGHLFAEPLARTGASDRVQLYGEVGLMYGNERTHAKITGLSTTAPVDPTPADSMQAAKVDFDADAFATAFLKAQAAAAAEPAAKK